MSNLFSEFLYQSHLFIFDQFPFNIIFIFALALSHSIPSFYALKRSLILLCSNGTLFSNNTAGSTQHKSI